MFYTCIVCIINSIKIYFQSLPFNKLKKNCFFQDVEEATLTSKENTDGHLEFNVSENAPTDQFKF